MKSILATILLVIVSFAIVPVSAQSSKNLRANGNLIKNPVSYASANAYTDGRGVWLEWQTELETKNLGFFVYRVDGGQRQLVSPSLIAGAYLQAQEEKITSGSYSFFDRFGDINSTYVIESYNLSTRRDDSVLVQTQMVDDLETVSGISSEQLNNQSINAKPFVLRNEASLPKELASEVESNSPQADPVKQFWVAAQPGVKINIKSEGFYRVPAADLQSAGFDISVPSARWQLYFNGVEQAINVGASGSYIEFYAAANGIDTNESDTQTYFLLAGAQNGKRIGTTLRRRVGSSVGAGNYQQSFYKKERFTYAQNYLNGDVENFFGTFIGSTTPGTVNFNLSGVDFNSPNSSIDLTLVGVTVFPHQTKITLNGVDLGVINGSNYNAVLGHFNFPTSVLREGANTIVFTSLLTSDASFFSSMKVNFARKYQADQNRLSTFVPNYKATYLEGFSSANVRVFDTTNPDAPTLISGLTVEQAGGTYRVYLPSNRNRVLYAVEDSALSQAFSVTPNTPSTLSATSNVGGMIIISHKNWLTEAENWANYRRGQGMTVKVINVDDIFDEFNYGVLKADTIRDFLQYAKNNWQTPPNYVLILGDSTYDPKNYLGLGNFNYVPTRIIDTIYTETGSDDTLADFNNDGLAEISIGRIPARNAATVTVALNKTMAFEQAIGLGQGIERGAVFAYDSPNGYDFQGLSERLRDQLPSNIPRIMVSRDAPDGRAQLLTQLNTGRFLVNYSGHGNVSVWSAGSFFNSGDAGALTNGSNQSIFTMLTCLNGYFIQPNDSMAEVLLKNPNGGAVSAWASTGLTTADIQEVMATRYYNQVAAGNITRLGDLIRDAKTTINFGRDVRLSWVLLGDPTLKVR